MCKSSSEPGGPQRCSGDTRAKAARSASDVAALEERRSDLRRMVSARPQRHCRSLVNLRAIPGLAG